MINAPIGCPVSRSTRTKAALLCALRASSCPQGWGATDALGVGWGSQAHRLADAAINLAWRSLHYRDACAEAEAMIRTWWSP